MKKTTLTFCVIFLILAGNVFSQLPSFSISPQSQCSIASGNNAVAAITLAFPSATSYSWSVTSPPSASATMSVLSTSGTSVSIMFLGCGVYTINCMAFNGNAPVGSLTPKTTTIICSNFITASANPSTGVLCSGASGVALGAGAQTYTWSNGSASPSIAVSPSVSTCYFVFGTNSSGCVDSAAVCFSVSQNPSVTVNASRDSLCAGESATLTAGGASTYSWNPGGSGSSILVSPAASTNYSVTGTNSVGCKASTAVFVVVNVCTGISVQGSSRENIISIYPNPSSGKLTLLVNGGEKMQYHIYDVIGREITKGEFTGSRTIDLSAYANGTYVISFDNENMKFYKKLILEK